MGFLEKVEAGKKDSNILASIFGPGGVGKSSWAADAPGAIFLPTEEGTNQLNVSRLPRPASFNEATKMVDELILSNHAYQTLVVDSIDWLEALCHQEVCLEKGVRSVSDVPYGQGFSLALVKFQDFIGKLKNLRAKMNIILICHGQIKTFNDPVTGASYDRFTLKLHEKVSALVKEAVDALLFATFETLIKKEGLKSRAFGDGRRILYTQHRPSHDAKNRFGLPYEMELSWEEFYKAAKSGGSYSADGLLEEIKGLTASLKDDELKKKVMETTEKAGKDVDQLGKILNRLRIKLEA